MTGPAKNQAVTRSSDPRIKARPAQACLLLVVLASLSVGSGGAYADEGGPPAPLTSYEAGPLRDANLIVAGWSLGAVPLGGTGAARQEIATIKVQRVLHGTIRAKEIRVYIDGPKPTRSLRQAKRTGFPTVDSGRHVFFLQQRGEGLVGARYRDSFVAEGAIGQEKIDCLETEARLARLKPAETRARATLEHLLGCLAAKGRWTRAHGSRELLVFAKARRDLMTRSVQDRIRSALTRRQPAATRSHLMDLLRHLRETAPAAPREQPARGAPVPPPASEAKPWQEAFRKADVATRPSLLERWLAEGPDREFLERAWWFFEQGEPADRITIVRILSRERHDDILPRLRRTYSTLAGQVDVRREIVLAVGRMGDDRVLPWLQERLSHRPVWKQAVLAMARVRTREAKRRLTALAQDLARRPGDEAKADLAWVEHLLRIEFPDDA